MSNITYGLIKETYGDEKNFRIAYGIAVYANFENDRMTTIVDAIHDVSNDAEKLGQLIRTCNCAELSLIHFRDVIEDYLSN